MQQHLVVRIVASPVVLAAPASADSSGLRCSCCAALLHVIRILFTSSLPSSLPVRGPRSTSLGSPLLAGAYCSHNPMSLLFNAHCLANYRADRRCWRALTPTAHSREWHTRHTLAVSHRRCRRSSSMNPVDLGSCIGITITSISCSVSSSRLATCTSTASSGA
jgi:hypothetical protein